MKRILTLDDNKKVISLKFVGDDYVLQPNDLETNEGDIGQIMQEDGTLIAPPQVVPEPEATLEDKINYLYYKTMGVI
ncbi:hypothetical protein [Clostridium sp. OS1-26]|uniref:hypothetical protein n=1 Tax=Clostridium sp. OS1-26 TaxID=3070681 RepID=UPI0027E0F1A8|nr:hypothetical protein [Clostridium sp. OS1-26]WML35335.1 hypothetical protein RCG18_00795 [Clostridium sp. OS1-26]